MKMTRSTPIKSCRDAVAWQRICIHLALIIPLSALAQTRSNEKADEVIELSRYEIQEKGGEGYATRQTLSQAGKLNTSLLNTPQLIVVANKQLLEDINIGSHDVLQAVQMVTGGVLHRSPQASDDFTIWGFRSANVLRDGIYVGTYAQAVMYDVDRVEIVKGPITQTYGIAAPTYAGFVGGAVNIVTRRPTREPTTETKLTFGNFGYLRGELHLSRPATENLRFRVDLGGMTGEGGPRRFAKNRDLFFGTGLDWDLSSKNNLKLDLTYFTTDFELPFTFLDDRTRKVYVAPDDFTTTTSLNNTQSKNFRGVLTFNSNLGEDLTMTATIAWIDFSWSYFQGYPLAGPDWATGLMPRTLAEGTTRRHNWYITQDFGKEFTLAGTKQKVTWGGLIESNVNNGYSNAYTVSPLNVYNPKAPETIVRNPAADVKKDDGFTKIWSAYIQDSMNLFNERLFITGALRYNGRQTPNSGPDKNKQVANYLSKRMGVVFKVTKDIGIYYNYAEGVMFGGGLDTYGRPFQPSIGKEKSFGVKTDLWDGLLTVSAVRFDLEMTNVFLSFVQGPGDPQPGFPGIRQSGSQNNEGYELNGSAHYALDRGTIDVIGSLFHGDMKNQLKERPVASLNNSASLFGKYTVTSGGLKGLAFGVGALAIGQSIISSFNTDGPGMGNPIRPAYTTTNAMVSYTYKDWRFQLNGNNLADLHHIEGAEFPNWVFTNPGRIIRASINRKF